MAEEIDMVNHPKHYAKESNDGLAHPECIDLLGSLTRGYSGIAAGCVMQFKYGYRAGSKADTELGQKKKTIEDFKKIIWYMNYFAGKAGEIVKVFDFSKTTDISLPEGFRCTKTDPSETEAWLIANEFINDKPASIRDDLFDAVITVYNMQTFGDLAAVIEDITNVVATLEAAA